MIIYQVKIYFAANASEYVRNGKIILLCNYTILITIRNDGNVRFTIFQVTSIIFITTGRYGSFKPLGFKTVTLKAAIKQLAHSE